MNLCSQNSGSVEDKKVTIQLILENLESSYMICIYLYFFAYSDIQSTLYGCSIVPTKIAMMHTQQIDIFYIHDMNCCFF